MNYKLYHFTQKPIDDPDEFEARFDHPRQADGDLKPRGLWLSDESVDTSWLSWCVSEQFGLDRLNYVHEIEIDLNTVARLDSPESIDSFTNSFDLQMYNNQLPGTFIDWHDVSALFNGILITPYQWDRRMTYMWYYGWDCASACIWNPRIITSATFNMEMPREWADAISNAQRKAQSA